LSLHASVDQDPSEPAASICRICAPHHETDYLITQADGKGLPVLSVAAEGQVAARLGNILALALEHLQFGDGAPVALIDRV
jgi:hypothetical protein